MRNTLIGLLIIVAIVTFGARKLKSASARQDSSADGSVLSALDTKAKNAQLSGGGDALRSYTDAVVDSFGPSGMAADIFKEKLFELESEERSGKPAGMTEGSLAAAINNLCVKIGAPATAQISTLQIRAMRATLHFRIPNAVAPKLGASSVSDIHAAISVIPKEMMPAEASIIISVLVQQKLSNSAFQVTPEQWNRQFFAAKNAPSNSRTDSKTSGYRLVQPDPPSGEGAKIKSSLDGYIASLQSTSDVSAAFDSFMGDVRQ